METDSKPQPQNPAPSGPTPLDYAQRPPLAWVSRHRKLLIFLALCIAIAGPSWWYWQPLKHRVLWLYWFHQAAVFRMPEKAIDLRINNPANAKRAVAADPSYQFEPATGRSQAPALYVPNIYRQLLKQDSRLSLTAGDYRPVAFMGTMVRPDGTRRLVIITVGQFTITFSLLQGVQILVLPIPELFDPLPAATYGHIGEYSIYGGFPPTAARWRSGKIDPQDHSHLVFEFVEGAPGLSVASLNMDQVNATGIIDAYLQNDDSMRFALRSYTGTDINARMGGFSLPGDLQTLQQEAARWGIPPAKSLAAPGAKPTPKTR